MLPEWQTNNTSTFPGPIALFELTIGVFYDVKITDSEEFDLYGTTINL